MCKDNILEIINDSCEEVEDKLDKDPEYTHLCVNFQEVFSSIEAALPANKKYLLEDLKELDINLREMDVKAYYSKGIQDSPLLFKTFRELKQSKVGA